MTFVIGCQHKSPTQEELKSYYRSEQDDKFIFIMICCQECWLELVKRCSVQGVSVIRHGGINDYQE